MNFLQAYPLTSYRKRFRKLSILLRVLESGISGSTPCASSRIHKKIGRSKQVEWRMFMVEVSARSPLRQTVQVAAATCPEMSRHCSQPNGNCRKLISVMINKTLPSRCSQITTMGNILQCFKEHGVCKSVSSHTVCFNSMQVAGDGVVPWGLP